MLWISLTMFSMLIGFIKSSVLLWCPRKLAAVIALSSA